MVKKVKKTARELLGDYIDLEIEVDSPDPDLEVLLPQMDKVKGLIKKKVDGIDHFMMELSRREHLIDAEIEALKSEETRLKVRRKAVQNLKDYFNGSLIPMIVEELGDDNGVYETDTARYKMFETWGPTLVLDEESVPDDFKKVIYTESVDKKKAKEVLKTGAKIPGLALTKVKRVRRS